MTTNPDLTLFSSQLTTVLDSENPDPIEVAILGGLLARVELQTPGSVDPALLARARAFVDDSEAIDQRIVDLPIEDAARQLFDAGSCAEQLDYLLELDELCAACWFADCPERAVPTIAVTARFIHAEPEQWKWLADKTSEMLSNLGRASAPDREDPAYRLWAAIEVAVLF